MAAYITNKNFPNSPYYEEVFLEKYEDWLNNFLKDTPKQQEPTSNRANGSTKKKTKSSSSKSEKNKSQTELVIKAEPTEKSEEASASADSSTAEKKTVKKSK